MLDDLDDDALDALPFGVVCLDQDNRVVRMNRIESEKSGIQRWRALGRDFFRDLAGPDAGELAAQVQALSRGARTRVYHRFRGFHRADDAVIDMSRCEADRVYLCIRSSRAM